MPDLKISQMADGGAVEASDELPVNRGGENFKVNVGTMAAEDAEDYTATVDLAAVALSGDAIDVLYDNTTSGLTASNVQSAIDELAANPAAGDVVGPASSTDNAVARYDGTGGKDLQNSLLIVDDSGNATATTFSATGSTIVLDSDATNPGTITQATLTAPRTWTLPNTSGTVTIGGNSFTGPGTTIVRVDDPNDDRILFWDDSAGSVAWLTAGAGLTITGTTISASGGSSGPVVIAAYYGTLSSGVLTQVSSFGFSSVSRASAGRFNLAFSTTRANTGYIVQLTDDVSFGSGSGVDHSVESGTRTTSGFSIFTYIFGTGASDPAAINITVFEV